MKVQVTTKKNFQEAIRYEINSNYSIKILHDGHITLDPN